MLDRFLLFSTKKTGRKQNNRPSTGSTKSQSINQSINQYKHKKGQTTHIWWRCQGPLPPHTAPSPHSGWTWLHSACLQSAQHNLTLNNSTIHSVVLPASHVPSLRHTSTLLGHQATNQQAKKDHWLKHTTPQGLHSYVYVDRSSTITLSSNVKRVSNPSRN